MKSLLLKVSIKYGLILSGLTIFILLYQVFNPISIRLTTFNLVISNLHWVFTIILVSMAHYEFNKQNGNYISYKDAIYSGLIVLAISFIINIVFSVINYEFFQKEEFDSFYLSLSERYGTEYQGFYSRLFSIERFVIFLIGIGLIFIVITAESLWKIYKKAGQKGWAAFVPIYNILVLLKIVKKPAPWIFLLLIPFINLVYSVWVTNLLAIRFNKKVGFTIGLIFLPFIFYPLLGMSKAEYFDGTIF